MPQQRFPAGVVLSGSTIPAGFRPLSDLEFVVLVGVTGVGKTTTLEALRSHGLSFTLLPDRRLVTDVVMIDALAGKPVTDREERFYWTARYRETHPGGMAQAIGQLAVNPEVVRLPLVFDGLRGLDEVSYAARQYTLARFVVLDAPDTVRVQRLLGRSDAFDQVRASSDRNALEGLQSIEGVRDVFSAAQLEQLAALERHGLSSHEIIGKTRIVVTERRHYDPVAAREFLTQLEPERVLYVDTTAHNPDVVAGRIAQWLEDRSS
jgi:predicted ATPase